MQLNEMDVRLRGIFSGLADSHDKMHAGRDDRLLAGLGDQEKRLQGQIAAFSVENQPQA